MQNGFYFYFFLFFPNDNLFLCLYPFELVFTHFSWRSIQFNAWTLHCFYGLTNSNSNTFHFSCLFIFLLVFPVNFTIFSLLFYIYFYFYFFLSFIPFVNFIFFVVDVSVCQGKKFRTKKKAKTKAPKFKFIVKYIFGCCCCTILNVFLITPERPQKLISIEFVLILLSLVICYLALAILRFENLMQKMFL